MEIMKEVRRIKFTGKNLNDVFALPCVHKIIKIIDTPQLVLETRVMAVPTLTRTARPGDELVEYDDGLWEIERNES